MFDPRTASELTRGRRGSPWDTVGRRGWWELLVTFTARSEAAPRRVGFHPVPLASGAGDSDWKTMSPSGCRAGVFVSDELTGNYGGSCNESVDVSRSHVFIFSLTFAVTFS